MRNVGSCITWLVILLLYIDEECIARRSARIGTVVLADCVRVLGEAQPDIGRVRADLPAAPPTEGSALTSPHRPLSLLGADQPSRRPLPFRDTAKVPSLSELLRCSRRSVDATEPQGALHTNGRSLGGIRLCVNS